PMVPWAVDNSLCAYFSASACLAASTACVAVCCSCSGGFWQPVSITAATTIRMTADTIPSLRIVFVLPFQWPSWGGSLVHPGLHGAGAYKRLRKLCSLLFEPSLLWIDRS